MIWWWWWGRAKGWKTPPETREPSKVHHSPSRLSISWRGLQWWWWCEDWNNDDDEFMTTMIRIITMVIMINSSMIKMKYREGGHATYRRLVTNAFRIGRHHYCHNHRWISPQDCMSGSSELSSQSSPSWQWQHGWKSLMIVDPHEYYGQIDKLDHYEHYHCHKCHDNRANFDHNQFDIQERIRDMIAMIIC